MLMNSLNDIAKIARSRAVVEYAGLPSCFAHVDVHAEMQLLGPLELLQQIAVVIGLVVGHLPF